MKNIIKLMCLLILSMASVHAVSEDPCGANTKIITVKISFIEKSPTGETIWRDGLSEDPLGEIAVAENNLFLSPSTRKRLFRTTCFTREESATISCASSEDFFRYLDTLKQFAADINSMGFFEGRFGTKINFESIQLLLKDVPPAGLTMSFTLNRWNQAFVNAVFRR